MQKPLSEFLVGGRFRVNHLGAYPSGDLYRVINTRLLRFELLKEFDMSAAKDENSRLTDAKRFWKEAVVGWSLLHPNLIEVYDFDIVNGVLCLLTQYALHGSLANWLREEGVPSIEVAVNWLQDAAHGLEALHSAGVIHRNVKPSNVLVSQDGRAAVGDFRFAQVDWSAFYWDERRGDLEMHDGWWDKVIVGEFSRLVDLGWPFDSVMPWKSEAFTPHPGTADYMSPEHNGPAPLEPASDVYSLGCVAFELLTGRRYALVKGQVQGPMELRADVPPWLNELVKRMLVEDVNQRFKSMQQVIESIITL